MEHPHDAELSIGRPDTRIATLAARQHGIFSRAQAADAGATRGLIGHRLRTGRWERVHARVFRVAGAPVTWRSSAIAACLAWGEPTAASHRTAARLWDLPAPAIDRMEVTPPVDRRRIVAGTLAYRARLPAVDRAVIDAVPVTTPARTILDLAAVVERALVEEALDDALRRGLVSLPRLIWRLEALGRRPGAAGIRRLIAARDPGTVPESVFETRLLRALAAAGLPQPVRQHPVRRGGRVVAVLDAAYPDAQVAVEADGYRWHAGRARFEHDRERLNHLAALGWRVVRITWRQLERDPDRAMLLIGDTLAAARRLARAVTVGSTIRAAPRCRTVDRTGRARRDREDRVRAARDMM